MQDVSLILLILVLRLLSVVLILMCAELLIKRTRTNITVMFLTRFKHLGLLKLSGLYPSLRDSLASFYLLYLFTYFSLCDLNLKRCNFINTPIPTYT